eukprot:scaffold72424_cov32-Prasinocladus_malaysianus.AAC.2
MNNVVCGKGCHSQRPKFVTSAAIFRALMTPWRKRATEPGLISGQVMQSLLSFSSSKSSEY